VPKRKVKVRFRRIWTVYYDLYDRGCVTSESFKTEALAWQDIARCLRSWLKSDVFADEAETVQKILALLAHNTNEAAEEARDLYVEMVEGPKADRVWIECTRLVSSRTPL